MTSISAAGLPMAIERQAAAAVEEADSLIMVVDGQVGAGVFVGNLSENFVKTSSI